MHKTLHKQFFAFLLTFAMLCSVALPLAMADSITTLASSGSSMATIAIDTEATEDPDSSTAEDTDSSESDDTTTEDSEQEHFDYDAFLEDVAVTEETSYTSFILGCLLSVVLAAGLLLFVLHKLDN